jgi:ACT domain-containing protein
MMKVDTVLKLKDVPGMLIKALEPISTHGGNIISVTHSRGEKGLVSVHVSFKVRDQSSLNLIRKALEKQGIHISEIEIEGRTYYTKKSLSFILLGHVIDTDIRDTLDRINDVGMVSGIEVVMPAPNQKSSVLMDVEIDEKSNGELIRLVERICKEKDFLLVRSL